MREAETEGLNKNESSRRARELEPLVVAAIQAKRSAPEPPQKTINGPFTFESYRAGVEQEFEKQAAVRPEPFIMNRLKKYGPGGYSDEDRVQAIQAANDLLTWGLLLESGNGDCQKAVDELAEKVPGFSRGLYEDIISYFGYLNR